MVTKAVKRFGNQVTLIDKPSVRANGKINPIYPPKIIEAYLQASIATLQQWTNENGEKLREPRTVISLDDRGLFLDQVCDVTDVTDGLAWFLESFNRSAYEDHLRDGIRRACDWWAANDWNRHLLISEVRIVETDQRADGRSS